MRIQSLFCSFLIFFLFSCIVFSEGSASIGIVKYVSGSASIYSSGKIIPAAAGILIHLNDILKTGEDGSIGVIFSDNTRVSLGPSSEVAMDSYTFEPRQGLFSFLLRLVKGTAAYVSGTIAKLAPESVKLQTPEAIVGVRGTRILLKVDS